MRYPFPVIIGAPRSGTTLLRLMLDSHPDLAIGPETHFLPHLAAIHGADALERVNATVVSSPSWADFGLSERDFNSALQRIEPFNLSEACRAFYSLYAAKFGKHRSGDKTPGYALHMETVQTLLPEAHFIHLIRDGRDVALSLRTMWFSPGLDIKSRSEFWARHVLSAKRSARACNNYIEIRYEELVREPEKVLRKICEFIDLRFDEAMLHYYVRAQARLDEQQGRTFRNGKVLSKEQRLRQQKHVALPLRESLVFRWRTEMTEAEKREFAHCAGDLLKELGYEV